VDPSVADADLDRLLARLLRVMNPAAGPGAGAAAAGQDHQERPGPADGPGQPDGPATEHTAAAETAFPAVSASEARALIELLAARGIAQGQLAALLGLEKSTVSRLAAGLERKGWLRRGRDEENQRFVRLYLTPEGRVIAAQVWQAWQSRQARILAGLSAEERAGLAAGLRGLVRGLAAEGLLEDAATEDAATEDAATEDAATEDAATEDAATEDGSPGPPSPDATRATPETRRRYTETPSAR
jgi:DNA-binding MarR family transcriptional regulator